MSTRSENAVALERELSWLSQLIDASIRTHFELQKAHEDVRKITPPELNGGSAAYAELVRDNDLCFEQRAILALALAPHVRPQVLDPFLVKNPNFERGFTEFGGLLGGQHSGFWPTVETAAFVLCGEDLERRFEFQSLLEPDGLLRAAKILHLDEAQVGQNLFSAMLQVGKETLNRLTIGGGYRPSFSSSFPAKRITTPLEWEDLVLPRHTYHEVEEIRAWIEHEHTLMHDWGLAKKIKPGFRSLFYGPPGTGKTLTATLLGKITGRDVYRVDLSLVVSKWVGETEKNLAAVFDQAEAGEWILFFDEADALFGKRTQTTSSNDRYANQEVAYLLQRIEDFPGVVILASNLKANIDEAFARRFQSMIFFPIPEFDERLRLWSEAFSDAQRLQEGVDFGKLARDYEITGGAIINVLRYASLMALRRSSDTVQLHDITYGIRREFSKDGKVI